MDTHKRDQERYEELTILEAKKASIPICPNNERDLVCRLMDSDLCRMIGSDIDKALTAADLTHEESIVVGVVALVRVSKLPHQAIFQAVTASLNAEKEFPVFSDSLYGSLQGDCVTDSHRKKDHGHLSHPDDKEPPQPSECRHVLEQAGCAIQQKQMVKTLAVLARLQPKASFHIQAPSEDGSL